MFISLRRIVGLALKDVVRNWWLSFATITVLFLALLSVNALLVIQVVTSELIQAVEDKVDVSITMRPDATQQEVDELRRYMIAFSEVRDVTFVSRDEAEARFRSRHADDDILIDALDALESNPFGASLILVATEVDAYGRILDRVASSPYQDLILDKSYGDHLPVIERLRRIADTTRQVLLAVSGVFLVIALLIIINTIRMMLYTHRDEIGIMKRVGATNQFARLPYVVASMIYGVLAFGLATIVFFALLKIGGPHMNRFLAGFSVDLLSHFRDNGLVVFGAELVGVLVLTSVSAYLATRRYLRV